MNTSRNGALKYCVNSVKDAQTFIRLFQFLTRVQRETLLFRVVANLHVTKFWKKFSCLSSDIDKAMILIYRLKHRLRFISQTANFKSTILVFMSNGEESTSSSVLNCYGKRMNDITWLHVVVRPVSRLFAVSEEEENMLLARVHCWPFSVAHVTVWRDSEGQLYYCILRVGPFAVATNVWQCVHHLLNAVCCVRNINRHNLRFLSGRNSTAAAKSEHFTRNLMFF